MKIRETTMLELLGEPDVQFRIPRYQRAYSWKTEQCEELWRDLMRAVRARRSHFAGAFIYLDEAGEHGEHGVARNIVDGQQRLTTVTLIVSALAAYLKERGESLFGIDASQLEEAYLRVARDGQTPASQSPGTQAKLVLSHADCDTLAAIACGTSLPERPSERIVENRALFEGKMREDDFDPVALWRGLSALTVIAIELDRREQAPEVFESLNSKSAPLVTADLVRNYLLLAENRREQTRLYEDYWSSIQGVFGDDPASTRLDNAILGWLSVRFRQVRKFGKEHAFSIFKSFCEDEYEGTTEALLDELYAFCLVWAENYRYHAVKKYKTADWARLGAKTRVSGRPRAALDNPESRDYYRKHFGVDPKW